MLSTKVFNYCPVCGYCGPMLETIHGVQCPNCGYCQNHHSGSDDGNPFGSAKLPPLSLRERFIALLERNPIFGTYLVDKATSLIESIIKEDKFPQSYHKAETLIDQMRNHIIYKQNDVDEAEFEELDEFIKKHLPLPKDGSTAEEALNWIETVLSFIDSY